MMKRGFKISVIVPVYNVEKYLPMCLESLYQQTLKDIEIIIINADSTDASESIVKAYQQKDKRIRIFDQLHQGQSVARNLGVKKARGKYIYFCDSDDYLEPDALEKLYERIEICSAQVIFFDAIAFSDDGDCNNEEVKSMNKYISRSCDYPEEYTGMELFGKMMDNDDWFCSPWCSMVSREFFLENNLFFTPGVRYEDNFYVFKTVLEADRACYLKRNFYHYRIRPFSSMTSKPSFANAYGSFIAVLDCIKALQNKSDFDGQERACVSFISGVQWQTKKLFEDLPEQEKSKYKELCLYEQLLFKMLIVEKLDLEQQLDRVRREILEQPKPEPRNEDKVSRFMKDASGRKCLWARDKEELTNMWAICGDSLGSQDMLVVEDDMGMWGSLWHGVPVCRPDSQALTADTIICGEDSSCYGSASARIIKLAEIR